MRTIVNDYMFTYTFQVFPTFFSECPFLYKISTFLGSYNPRPTNYDISDHVIYCLQSKWKTCFCCLLFHRKGWRLEKPLYNLTKWSVWCFVWRKDEEFRINIRLWTIKVSWRIIANFNSTVSLKPSNSSKNHNFYFRGCKYWHLFQITDKVLLFCHHFLCLHFIPQVDNN